MEVKERWRILDEFLPNHQTLLLRRNTPWGKINSNLASQNRGDVTSQRLEGLYFGMSDNELGQRAWLLRLETEIGKGSLYMPPNNLELSHVEISSKGRLTFRSDIGLGDVTYSFDGQITSSGIRGVFHITRARPSANEEIGGASVTLQKLDNPLLNKRLTANIGGLYSNVEYNEEGGDLTGEELILILKCHDIVYTEKCHDIVYR